MTKTINGWIGKELTPSYGKEEAFTVWFFYRFPRWNGIHFVSEDLSKSLFLAELQDAELELGIRKKAKITIEVED